MNKYNFYQNLLGYSMTSKSDKAYLTHLKGCLSVNSYILVRDTVYL